MRLARSPALIALVVAVGCANGGELPFVSGGDGGSPAQGDGSGGGGHPGADGASGAGDSGAAAEAGSAETGTPETGTPAGDSGGGSCTAVAVSPAEPAHGDGACAQTGACYPHDVTAFGPTWVPPLGPHAGACTGTQITAFYDACLGPSGSGSSCQTWTTASANTACYACLDTPNSASAYGALIDYSGIVFANVGGCVSIVEPCNLPCAKAFEAISQCTGAACDPATVCTSQTAYDTCAQAAQTGTCACDGFQKSANCMGAVSTASHPAYAACLGSQTTDFETVYAAVASVICGP